MSFHAKRVASDNMDFYNERTTGAENSKRSMMDTHLWLSIVMRHYRPRHGHMPSEGTVRSLAPLP